MLLVVLSVLASLSRFEILPLLEQPLDVVYLVAPKSSIVYSRMASFYVEDWLHLCVKTHDMQ